MKRFCLAFMMLLMAFSCSKKNTVSETSSAEGINENLKKLEWLIGSWKDDAEDMNLTNTYKWDLFNHFLIQEFVFSRDGQEDLKGKQIIVWDPNRKTIRSFVFDSDGGFGDGTWENRGDAWFVLVRYTLPDGELASATHIYRKIDDKTYSFSSQDRDIDGEIQPNIGPFNSIRQ